MDRIQTSDIFRAAYHITREDRRFAVSITKEDEKELLTGQYSFFKFKKWVLWQDLSFLCSVSYGEYQTSVNRPALLMSEAPPYPPTIHILLLKMAVSASLSEKSAAEVIWVQVAPSEEE